MMSGEKYYYIALNSSVFGPYTFDEISSIGLQPDTLVATSEKGAGWNEARSYSELSFLFLSGGNTGHKAKCAIWRRKRRKALIGMLTLGLAGLFVMGIDKAWGNNIFAGTSLDTGGVGFVLKIISFLIVSMMLAVPFFILSVIRFIYYQIKIATCK